LCPSTPPTLEPLASMAAQFRIGTALVVAGTVIRMWSYRALGALFTFEVVIKDDHRLITWGPYKHVRHPAYSGLALLLVGTHLIHFGEGGYVAYCGLSATPIVVFVNIWRAGSLFTLFSLCRRCGIEDGQLRDMFGAEWEQYRRNVPCALLPFVY
ncbi:hypothetical protein BD413DRAFT_456488, partial [Trametes elegans]